jgi:hypothetical protein
MSVYIGAPQGADLLVYMGLNQAIWRAGNGLTYAYPFSVPPDASAAVLFQLPFAFTSLIGRWIGLPASYEVIRVLGAAAFGALLPTTVRLLLPTRAMVRTTMLALLLAGTVFYLPGAAMGIREAGLSGLSILPDWTQIVSGHFYWWLPNLVTSLRLPVEPWNHATVLLVFLGIGLRRPGLALTGGILAWLTNPFPGILASIVGLGVAGWSFLILALRLGPVRALPTPAGRQTVQWFLLTATALAYYGPFLSQWPDIAEVSRMCRLELTPAPKPTDMLWLVGPWGLGLLAIPRVLRTDSRGLRHPLRAALAIMAVGQLFLQTQGWWLGERAFQPYHFNRGWLGFSLILLVAIHLAPVVRLLRRALPVAIGRLRLPRTRAALLLWLTLATSPDVVFFLLRDFLDFPPSESYVRPDMVRVLQSLREIPDAPRLVYSIEQDSVLPIAAFTPHVPYSSTHWIAYPFSARRTENLQQAWNQAGESPDCPVHALGITVLILPTQVGAPFDRVVKNPLWVPQRFGRYTLYVARNGKSEPQKSP